jgi:hypothetical protein
MYHINLDVINKIICVEIFGSMSSDELIAYTDEINNILSEPEFSHYSLVLLEQD